MTLFNPVSIGAIDLPNRVIMAPMTRSRSTQPGDVPNAMMAEYYVQRASTGMKMTEVTFLPNKALIYATNKRGLLIFQEPDFPEVPPQVPGGTIDNGEDPLEAAKREFAEETGILTPTDMTFLELDKHAFERNGRPHQVNRYYYHTAVPDDLPETWDDHEHFAHDGADPILFRFSWLNLNDAPDILGFGMQAAIPSLTARLAEIP